MFKIKNQVNYFLLPWISWVFKALKATIFYHKDSKSLTYSKILCFFVDLALFAVIIVLTPCVAEKSCWRYLAVSFASYLCIRKEFPKVLLTFPSSILVQVPWFVITPIHYCGNIDWQFFQFLWVFSFSQPAIVNFVFTKLLKCVMNARCAPMTSRIIEPDVLHNWRHFIT